MASAKQRITLRRPLLNGTAIVFSCLAVTTALLENN
jgi:hypothetical protein